MKYDPNIDLGRPPDFSGQARAWKVRQTPEGELAHAEEWGYVSASLGQYFIHGPYHPFWSWWMIGLIHLREIEGCPPAQKHYPEAEYEIMCVSLSPEPEAGKPLVPDLARLELGDGDARPVFMSPPDWVVQFDGVDDEQAREVLRLAARAVAEGGVSCDSDMRSWWKRAIPNTVKHILGEPH